MRRRLPLLTALLILYAGAVPRAIAGVPDATASSVEPVIVGDASGAPIGDGFEVVARHISGAPADPGTVIMLLFSGTGVVPYSAQAADVTVDCTARTISKVADRDGRAVFFPRLGGFANGLAVQVRAGGVLLRTVPARSTDLNADGRTDVADLKLFRDGFLSQAAETDYDLDGKTTLKDLLILRGEIVAAAGGTLCP